MLRDMRRMADEISGAEPLRMRLASSSKVTSRT
jgi:hypothetical protein